MEATSAVGFQKVREWFTMHPDGGGLPSHVSQALMDELKRIADIEENPAPLMHYKNISPCERRGYIRFLLLDKQQAMIKAINSPKEGCVANVEDHMDADYGAGLEPPSHRMNSKGRTDKH